MGAQPLLDGIPIPVLFVALALLAFAIHEGGFQLGMRRERLDPSEKDGPTGLLVGAILALMGFLLATTTAMAADRFDGRRALVVDEANVIETAFQRAGYLEAPASTEIRNLLREYAPLRINLLDNDEYARNLAASKEKLDQIWTKTQDVAKARGNQPVVALYVQSINDAFDILHTREAALTNGRVPESIIWLVLLGAMLSAGVVGFYAGLLRRRGFVGAVALIVILSAALVFVVGLDRPRDDLLRVSQQPIESVIAEMGPAE